MVHPNEYLLRVTKFLDFLIQEYGHLLFIGLVYVCLFLLAWIFLRRRKGPVHDVRVVILPLYLGRKTKPELEPSPFPSPFESHDDL